MPQVRSACLGQRLGDRRRGEVVQQAQTDEARRAGRREGSSICLLISREQRTMISACAEALLDGRRQCHRRGRRRAINAERDRCCIADDGHPEHTNRLNRKGMPMKKALYRNASYVERLQQSSGTVPPYRNPLDDEFAAWSTTSIPVGPRNPSSFFVLNRTRRPSAEKLTSDGNEERPFHARSDRRLNESEQRERPEYRDRTVASSSGALRLKAQDSRSLDRPEAATIRGSLGCNWQTMQPRPSSRQKSWLRQSATSLRSSATLDFSGI